MNLDWLDAFLISGLFFLVMIAGLALLLHLQLGLARIANFGVVGFWGIGMYSFGVLFVKVDWPFGDPWPFLISAVFGAFVAGLSGLLIGWLIADLDDDGVLVGTSIATTNLPNDELLAFSLAIPFALATKNWNGCGRNMDW